MDALRKVFKNPLRKSKKIREKNVQVQVVINEVYLDHQPRN